MKRFCLLLLIALGCRTLSLADGLQLETVAGTGAPKNNGDAGSALRTNIGLPFGVEIGPDGALYITEIQNHRVLRLELTTGELSTVAGCGRKGYSGDGGPAVEAELNEPYEVRFDNDGNIYFVEMRNHVIRRIDAKTKTINTVAGTGRQGYSGDGGPATEAMLNQPHSIALDKRGALYVADIGNHRIRRIDPESGIIESIAGNNERRLPQHGQSAAGSPILGPRALCIDGNTLWIALREGHSVWRIDLADGVLHHVAGTGKAGYAGDGGPAKQATFNGPKGIAIWPGQDVFIADTENDAIRKIDLESGTISTVADGPPGNGHADVDNPTTNPPLNRPHGICVAPDGSIYIGDTLNHLVRRVR